MSGSVQCNLQILASLILTTILHGRYYYYPPFADEEGRQSEVKSVAQSSLGVMSQNQDLNAM